MDKTPAKYIGLLAIGLVIVAVVALFYFGPEPADKDDTVTVFAASSFAWVLHENRDLIERQTGLDLIVVAAASSTLARQIAEGAPADMFITADNVWLDYLAEKGVQEGDAQEIARNRLGLAFDLYAFAKICTFLFRPHPDAPRLLETCPVTERLATGDPESVPLGKYATEAISFYGWDFPIAPSSNARAALALLEANVVIGGIFYRTDVLSSEKLVSWYEIPEESHSPIIYWAVPLKDSNGDATENFINFLKSETFRTILEDKGFAVNYN